MSNMAEQTAEQPTVSSDLTAMQTCGCMHVLGDHQEHGPCKRRLCECTQFERVYSSMELVALTGATYRQIDHWTRCGYLPNEDPTPGHGYSRWWTHEHVELVRLVVALATFGLLPQRGFEIAHQLLATDLYSLTLADIWQLSIRLIDTAPTSPQEGTTP